MKMNVTFKEQNEVLKASFGEVVEVGGGGAELAAFWDSFQDNGKRGDYGYAFLGQGWNNETFKPKHDIKPTNAYMLFMNSKINGSLVEILENCGVALDTSKATNTQYVFQGSLFTHIGRVDVTSSTNSVQTDSLCRSCANLVRFDTLVINEKTKFAANTFNGCSALEYVGFEGVISNSLYLQYSPLLTAECVKNILLQLADYSGTDKNLINSVSFHSSVWDMLNAEGNTAPGGISWADYVYNKGWNK